MNHSTRARAYERLARLDGAKVDLATYFGEATRLLASAVPHDCGCWHTMDPTTLVETGYLVENMPAPTPAVAEFAYLAGDYNSFVQLTKAKRHSGVLSEATEGHLDRSVRYRELLGPSGVTGELRTSFVVDGVAWGCFSLFREAPRDFTTDERDFTHDLAALLGRGFRAASVRSRTAGDDETRWPGLVLLDGRRRVESLTAPARRWLTELGFRDEEQLPFALLAAAERVRDTGGEATARVRGESGNWVHVHASPVTGEGPPGRVAIILQAATAPAITPLISATYELTARERELTELVLQGCGTSEIAARLYISPHTVQGHLKSIFAKTGVRSRRELVTRVFAQHDQPPRL